MRYENLFWILWVVTSFLFASRAFGQCQQHVLSTVPATEWSTWEYQDCETGEIQTQSLPCCGWTLPICAELESVNLIEGDGFDAVLLNEVGPPWESCIPYNDPPCPGDYNEDGIINVTDLLILLSQEPGTGELTGLLQNYGIPCED
jgi:hypothetical protein